MVLYFSGDIKLLHWEWLKISWFNLKVVNVKWMVLNDERIRVIAIGKLKMVMNGWNKNSDLKREAEIWNFNKLR
jgi:hypothetical protein